MREIIFLSKENLKKIKIKKSRVTLLDPFGHKNGIISLSVVFHNSGVVLLGFQNAVIFDVQQTSKSEGWSEQQSRWTPRLNSSGPLFLTQGELWMCNALFKTSYCTQNHFGPVADVEEYFVQLLLGSRKEGKEERGTSTFQANDNVEFSEFLKTRAMCNKTKLFRCTRCVSSANQNP